MNDSTRKSGEQIELEGKAKELKGRAKDALGDLTFKLGAMLGFSGQWRKLNLYALLPYTATGIPSEASPWGFLTGVSLPIAPWERSKK